LRPIFTDDILNRMIDNVTVVKRSWIMSQVRGKDSKPEIIVRSMLHQSGYRFRLHRKDLPGKPDLVLPKYRTVIFVHGCFWHRHRTCRKASLPQNNQAFWKAKFLRNAERDLRNNRLLRRKGWHVVVVWECEIKKSPEKVMIRIQRKLANT
jgi:DNA mismatch endonuclease (patch repair protein)